MGRLSLPAVLALVSCGFGGDRADPPTLPQRSRAASAETAARPGPTQAIPAKGPSPAGIPALSRDPFLTPEEEAALTRPDPPPRPPAKVVRSRLRLEAVIVPDDGRRKVAVVNGHPFVEGERIGDEELAAIESDHIDLLSPRGVRRRIYFEKGRAPAIADSPEGPASLPPREAMQRTDSR